MIQAATLVFRELRRFPALAAWTFGWNRRTRAHGLCRYDRRRIELSAPLTAREPEADLILNTIRHEIAHALAGPGTGHGLAWCDWARRVGCTHVRSARASSPDAAPIPPRYVLVAVIEGQEQVVQCYYRRPSRGFLASLPRRHLRGRPETLGTLRVLKAG